MDDCLPKLIWTSIIFALILLLVCSPAEAGYEALEEKLEAGERVGEEVLDELPAPTTSRRYWLYGRAVPDVNKTLEMLEQAVESTSAQAEEVKYFSSWVEVALISGRGEKEFFRRKLDKFLDSPGEAGVDFWLETGRLAEQFQYWEGADRAYQAALEVEPEFVESLLYRARVKLHQGEDDRAEKHLREYFLEPGNGVESLYWILKGRLFEQRGADTEAYVAYSHVVNHYPESMLLSQAEEKIRKIPLPSEFYIEDISADQIESLAAPDAKDDMGKPPDPVDEEPAFRIQIGAFQKREQAENFAADVSNQVEVDVYIHEAEVDGTLYYRVQVGAMDNRDDAEALQSELGELGYEGFVVHQ